MILTSKRKHGEVRRRRARWTHTGTQHSATQSARMVLQRRLRVMRTIPSAATMFVPNFIFQPSTYFLEPSFIFIMEIQTNIPRSSYTTFSPTPLSTAQEKALHHGDGPLQEAANSSPSASKTALLLLRSLRKARWSI